MVICTRDQTQWTALGSPHDRTEIYGIKLFERVISDINTNILLIFFPIDLQSVAGLYPPPPRLTLPFGGRVQRKATNNKRSVYRAPRIYCARNGTTQSRGASCRTDM